MIVFDAIILSDKYPLSFPVVAVIVHNHSHSPATFPAAYRKDVSSHRRSAHSDINAFLRLRSRSSIEIKTVIIVLFAGQDGVAVIATLYRLHSAGFEPSWPRRPPCLLCKGHRFIPGNRAAGAWNLS